MRNTIWAPNTMLSSRKKLKSQFQENFWTGRTHPSAYSQGSNKRVSQLRGITVDNKNKTQYNSANHIYLINLQLPLSYEITHT